jgi:putative flippase GtrA
MTTPFLVACQTHSRSDQGVALRVGIHHGSFSTGGGLNVSNQTIIINRDLRITLILAKIWEFTIDFIVKNLMKFANIELCRGL